MTAARIPPAAVFALGLLFTAVALAPFVWGATFSADAFTQMSQAKRILAGEAMYRDFFELLPPGSFWLLTAAFAIAGPSLWLTNLVQVAAIWVASAQLWDVTRRLGVGPWLAWLPGLTLVFALYPRYPGFYHHWLVLVLVIGCLQLALRALDAPGPRLWAGAGAIAGLTLVTVQSDGAVLLVALLGTIGARAWLAGRPWREAARDMAYVAAGFAAPLLAVALALALQGALGAALYDVFVWPLKFYKGEGGINDRPFATDLPKIVTPVKALPWWYGRLLHFGLLYALFVGVGLTAMAWGLGLAWRRLRRGPGLSAAEGRLGLAGLTALGFMALSTRGRADFVHVAMYLPPTLAFATALCPRWAARFPGDHLAGVRALPALALALYMGTGAGMVVKEIAATPANWLPGRDPDQAMRDTPVIRYLREHMRPGDRMVALPAGGFYYFYGPPPATRNSYVLPPGRGYTPEAEWHEVGREIATNKPRFIVVATWPWRMKPREWQLGVFEALFMPGYRRVADLATPQWGGVWLAAVYERVEAGAPAQVAPPAGR